MKVDEIDGAVACVTEEPERGAVGRVSGLFSAQCEGPDGRTQDGPENMPIEDALEWARKRAAVVTVLVFNDGDGLFTAGSRDPEDQDLPRWRDGTVVRSRPEGTPLDGSQQDQEWDLTSTVAKDMSAIATPETVAQTFATHLGHNAGSRTRVSPHGIAIEYTVRAPSLTPAVQRGDELVLAALRELIPSEPRPDLLVSTTGR